MKFSINYNDSKSLARSGKITTFHSEIETPVFMPVGTQAAVKTIDPAYLKSANVNIILSNTYHLYLRPGMELIKKAGGLHAFMNWDNSILTDSGGFQIFSLAKLNHISDEGVEFQSHLDGSKHLLSPELSMEIQRSLGSDIIMSFDHCPPSILDKKSIDEAVERTNLWTDLSVKYLNENPSYYDWDQAFFPIIQGGVYTDLREKSATALVPLAKCGIAIGGLAVGEKKSSMFNIIEFLNTFISKDQPKYLMGVGRPTDLIKSILLGVDMFDCVLPTRNARNGQLFTSAGIINIENAKYKESFDPIDSSCSCYACLNFTKSYIRHLFNIKEVLGLRLSTIHNLAYYSDLMNRARKEIKNDNFEIWSKEYLKKMRSCPGM